LTLKDERAVLASFLVGSPDAPLAFERLSAADFFDRRNAITFTTLQELRAKQIPTNDIDILMDCLGNSLGDEGETGLFLSELISGAPKLRKENIEYHIQAVRRASRHRDRQHAAQRITEMLAKQNGEAYSADYYTQLEILKQPVASTNDGSRITLVPADSVTPRAMEWLYPDRIMLKHLTLFCGPPDVGKDAISLDIIARLTTGADFPDRPNEHGALDVIVLASEENIDDTIVPRLMVAGADLTRVHFATQTVFVGKEKSIERKIALDQDLDLVRKLFRENPSAKLLFISPLSSYLGKLKKNSDDDVRPLLDNLKLLAEELGIAVLCILHFNKNLLQDSIDRIGGAGAFVKVPRAVWCFVKDDEDDTGESRFMLNVKLNNVKKSKKNGLRFRMNEAFLTIGDKEVGMPRVEWLGPASRKIDSILRDRRDPEGGETKIAACMAWLRRCLEDGPKLARNIFADAESQDFNEKLVKRAKARLRIDSSKKIDGWYWWMTS